MSQRLPELLRQRALLQEHLAWLEHEIATEQGTTTSTPPPLPAPGTHAYDVRHEIPVAHPTSAASALAPTELPADLEKIVAQYRQDPGTLTQDTRRGCLIIFWIALAGSLLTSALVYWLYARHIGRWW